jgi:mannan endo-1,4-beta-mannosidase
LRIATVAVVLSFGPAFVLLPPAGPVPALASTTETAFTPSDPQASAATASELNYLGNLPDTGRFLTGYFAGYSSDSVISVDDLYHASGQYPGLAECDYEGFANTADPTLVDASGCDGYLDSYWQAGGLVEVGFHANNPTGGGYSTGLTASQIATLTESGNQVYANWHEQLDEVAAGLNQLGADGVVVIFRPLMEMNATGTGWFWWNGGGWTGPEYVTVWRDMYDTIEGQLTYHNVLWDWSPDESGVNPTAAGDSYYPGASYVDVTGLDVYQSPTTKISYYSDALEPGKPFGFNEIGYQPPPAGSFSAWPSTITSTYPKASFFLSWNGEYGPTQTGTCETGSSYAPVNSGAQALMNASPEVNLAGSQLLAGFEDASTDGWGGWTSQSGALAGPWSISSADGSDWAVDGQYALKANITSLGVGQQAILNDYGAYLNLANDTSLSAIVNVASWNSPAAGMTAELYVRTGPDNTWYSGPTVPVSYSASGTTVTMSLAGIPNLDDVMELGVDFVPTTGATSGSVYVDHVTVTGPLLIAGFEGGCADDWTGSSTQSGALAGPWSVSSADGSDWAVQGQYALKANLASLGAGQQVTLGEGAQVISSDPGVTLDFAGQSELSAIVNVASWNSPAAGMTASIYVQTGSANTVYSGPTVPVSYTAGGTTVSVSLSGVQNLDDVTAIGVVFTSTAAATTGSVYVDDVAVQ